MPTTIRPATPDDAAGITRIHVGSWKRTYRGILPDERLNALNVEEQARIRRGRLTNPYHAELRDWVLVEEDEIIGWAATGPARDDDLDQSSHELLAIYLDPDRVGEGHGRALMKHSLGDAARRGGRPRRSGFMPQRRDATLPLGRASPLVRPLGLLAQSIGDQRSSPPGGGGAGGRTRSNPSTQSSISSITGPGLLSSSEKPFHLQGQPS